MMMLRGTDTRQGGVGPKVAKAVVSMLQMIQKKCCKYIQVQNRSCGVSPLEKDLGEGRSYAEHV